MINSMSPQEQENVVNCAQEAINKVTASPERASSGIPHEINIITRLLAAGGVIKKNMGQYFKSEGEMIKESSTIFKEGGQALSNYKLNEGKAIIGVLPAIIAIASTEGAATPTQIQSLLPAATSIFESFRKNAPAVGRSIGEAFSLGFRTEIKGIKANYNTVKGAVDAFIRPPA